MVHEQVKTGPLKRLCMPLLSVLLIFFFLYYFNLEHINRGVGHCETKQPGLTLKDVLFS